MTQAARKPASPQASEAELAQGLVTALGSALGVISETAQSRGLFPFGITKINLSLTLPGGISGTIDIEGPSSGPALTASAPAQAAVHAHFAAEHAALDGGLSIDDLQLAPHARAAAQSLLDQFGADIVFTSGRRSVQSQARAMAHNIVKTGNRQWIAKTYVHGQALQDWVDAHPEAQSEDDLAQGLESVMNSWTDAQLGALSFHLSGAAFDLAPVAGDQGDAIKAAINVLPNLNKFIDGESGVNVWHLQFDE